MRGQATRRFLRYIGVGVPTAALDITLVYLLTSWVGFPYVISVGAGYLVGITLNYVLSRNYVFKHSTRKFHHGYLFMVAVAGGGALLTATLTLLLVKALALHYLTARVGVAGMVGVANYLFNLHINFKVAGRH